MIVTMITARTDVDPANLSSPPGGSCVAVKESRAPKARAKSPADAAPLHKNFRELVLPVLTQ